MHIKILATNYSIENKFITGIDEQPIIVFISVESKMGRGQAVRQRVLVPLFGGSNPSVPDDIYS